MILLFQPFDVTSPIICDMEERGENRAISETTRQALLNENQGKSFIWFHGSAKKD